MGIATGNPRGRPPGAATRLDPRKVLQITREALVKQYGDPKWHHYDPVVQMALIGCDDLNPVEVRLVAHSRVAKYIYPELKSVELTGEDGGPVQFQMGIASRIVDVIESQK